MNHSKRYLKGVKGWAAILLAAVLVLGIGSAAPAADTVVRIGNIIPLSGPSASVGQQGQNAAQSRRYQIEHDVDPQMGARLHAI